MSLRKRTILTVGTALVALILAVDLVSRYAWIEGFVSLEQDTVRSHVAQCLDAVHWETEQLDKQAKDWSDWDDLYEYVRSPSPQFVESNILPSVFENLRLNFIVVIDSAGNLVHGTAYDLAAHATVPLPDDVRDALGVAPYKQRFADMKPHKGILVASEPMLVAIGRSETRNARNLPAASLSWAAG